MQIIKPTRHEKAEWSRLAQDAYARDMNTIGHAFSAHASRPHNWAMSIKQFDTLQAIYRAWLIHGTLPTVKLDGSVVFDATATEDRP